MALINPKVAKARGEKYKAEQAVLMTILAALSNGDLTVERENSALTCSDGEFIYTISCKAEKI